MYRIKLKHFVVKLKEANAIETTYDKRKTAASTTRQTAPADLSSLARDGHSLEGGSSAESIGPIRQKYIRRLTSATYNRRWHYEEEDILLGCSGSAPTTDCVCIDLEMAEATQNNRDRWRGRACRRQRVLCTSHKTRVHLDQKAQTQRMIAVRDRFINHRQQSGMSLQT